MSTDWNLAPLHVQTANSLGWINLRPKGNDWWGTEPHAGLNIQVPRYDQSWCSVGALLERFKIGVFPDHGQWIAEHSTPEGLDQYAGGERPTEAVAKLVVHLKQKGLLIENV